MFQQWNTKIIKAYRYSLFTKRGKLFLHTWNNCEHIVEESLKVKV